MLFSFLLKYFYLSMSFHMQAMVLQKITAKISERIY
jgi:hypothetical protein